MYFVAECTTISAPHCRGWIKYGVATVLSTISGTPTSWATAATVLDIQHVVLGVGDRSQPKNALVFGRTAAAPGLRIIGVLDEADLDAELRQRVVEQVVGSAIEAGAGHNVVAGLGHVEDGQGLGGLTAGDQQRTDAALKRRDAILHSGLGRIHDPGVDVAEFFQREEVRRHARCC